MNRILAAFAALALLAIAPALTLGQPAYPPPDQPAQTAPSDQTQMTQPSEITPEETAPAEAPAVEVPAATAPATSTFVGMITDITLTCDGSTRDTCHAFVSLTAAPASVSSGGGRESEHSAIVGDAPTLTLYVPASATITWHGMQVPVSALTVGDVISIDYRTDASGFHTASAVTLQARLGH